MDHKFVAISAALLIAFFVYGIFFIEKIDIEKELYKDKIILNNGIVKEHNNAELDIYCLNNINFEIKTVCMKEDRLKLSMLNNKEAIENFILKIYRDREEKVPLNEKLGALGSGDFFLKLGYSPDKIEIFPVIKFNKDLALCRNFKTYKSIQACEPECKEAWICTGWEECKDNSQKRNCVDLNECTTDLSKPESEQQC